MAPTDTLTAAQSIARYPWYQPERLFALLDQFYAIPTGKTMRAVPYMPYLKFSPSAWVLPLKVTGGGYRAGGKAMFDSEGNLWVGDNFTVGWQGQDDLWQGNATKFAPNGRPLSPMTTGFAGGGMQGGTFGAAVDAKDNAWLTSYGGKSIAVFDKNGKPLTPPDGITFDGKLGLMQGVIVTPSGDVWVLGVEKSQLVFFPKGDLGKAKLLCEGDAAEPCKSFKLPFHLGIDQQDRIWVTNAGGDFVIRFPAGDPSKVEKFKSGYSGSGLGIDSQGNVWVTNRFGSGVHGLERMAKVGILVLLHGDLDFDRTLAYHHVRPEGWPGRRQRHAPPARRDGVSRLSFYGRELAWSVGRYRGWRRHGLDLELRGCGRSDRAPVRRQDRELPARHEDRRSDLAAGRLRRRRPADADRPRDRSGRERLGDGQLAGHQQLLRQRRPKGSRPAAAARV